MPFFHREGIDFHYLDSGEGIPFVFQHGLGGDVNQPAEVYQPQPGIRFLSMDCRGHGATQPLGDEEKIGFAAFAGDVVALMNHLDVPCAVVGGISMGAGVGFNIALRCTDRVLGLVLSRPAWLDRPMPAHLRIMTHIARLIRDYGAQQGLERFQASEEYEAILRCAPDVASSLVMQFTHPRAQETVIKLQRLPKDVPHPNRQEWGRISLPTLILANHSDPLHPFKIAETLAAAIPGARLLEITSKSVSREKHLAEARAYITEFLHQFTC